MVLSKSKLLFVQYIMYFQWSTNLFKISLSRILEKTTRQYWNRSVIWIYFGVIFFFFFLIGINLCTLMLVWSFPSCKTLCTLKLVWNFPSCKIKTIARGSRISLAYDILRNETKPIFKGLFIEKKSFFFLLELIISSDIYSISKLCHLIEVIIHDNWKDNDLFSSVLFISFNLGCYILQNYTNQV